MRSSRFSSLRAAFSDFLGHSRVGDRLVELGDFRGAFVALAQLFLDRAHLLAQQMLAIDIADRFARALVDFARHLQHLDPMREELEQLVEARLEVEGFQQRLLFLGGDVHQAGNEIREARRTFHPLQRHDHLFGNLRQELQNLDGALLQRTRAAFDFGVDLFGVFEVLHARDGERISLQELEDAEAALALGDRMMDAVGGGDVAQHAGVGAHPMQVIGAGLLVVGLALQQDADRTLQAYRLLHGGARAIPPHRERKHHAGEHHDVADRKNDQRVVGQRARCALGVHVGTRRARDGRVGGKMIRVAGFRVFVHECPSPILLNRKIRQP